MSQRTHSSQEEEFWKILEPVLFPTGRMENTPTEVDKLLTLMDLPNSAFERVETYGGLDGNP